jgi:hypothetical protein
MKVRINHDVNETTTVETKKLQLVLQEGKIIAVDTDKQVFGDVTLIEFIEEEK